MKKTILSISIIGIVCIFTNKVFAQTDPAYDSIASLNLNIYASLPVDSLLHHIPQSYNYIALYGNLKNDRIRGLGIRYPSGMTIDIVPKTYNFMNPIDPTRNWNLELFKKEIAYDIAVGHPDHAPRFGYPIGSGERH